MTLNDILMLGGLLAGLLVAIKWKPSDRSFYFVLPILGSGLGAVSGILLTWYERGLRIPLPQ